MTKLNNLYDNKMAIKSLEYILQELKEDNIRVTGCNLNYNHESVYSPNVVKKVSFLFEGISMERNKETK